MPRPSDSHDTPSSSTSALQKEIDDLRFQLEMAKAQVRKETGRRRTMSFLLGLALVFLVCMFIGGGVVGVLVLGGLTFTNRARMAEMNARRAMAQAQMQAERAARAAADEREAMQQAVAEANARADQTEKLIREALDEAAKQRDDLQKQLKEPAGVFHLLEQPAEWKARIDTARQALKRADALQKAAPGKIDDKIKDDLQKLKKDIDAGEMDRLMAEQLEAIRLERATAVDPKNGLKLSDKQYEKAFRQLGTKIPAGNANQEAKSIRESAIRTPLLGALDDWAFVAWNLNNKQRTEQLLAIARLADPNPLRDKLRSPQLWTDRNKLEKLAITQPVNQLSSQQLFVLADALEKSGGDAKALLRKAVALHPDDFWLNLKLAGNTRDFDEAMGLYRAALALRPNCAAVRHRMGKALFDQNDLEGAAAEFQKAILLDPSPPAGHRYWAARVAMKQAIGASEQKQKQLRQQALMLLQQEIAAWSQDAKKNAEARQSWSDTIKQWQADPVFAGVRGKGIASLPEDEREPWRKLWKAAQAKEQP